MSFWQRLTGRRAAPDAAEPRVEPTVEIATRPRNATQSASGGVLINTSEELERYLRSGEETESGSRVTAETAMRVAAVFACVRLRSGVPGNMPVGIKRRLDDRTRADATDHPVWSLFHRRPNRWQTVRQFKVMMQAHLLLRGNAYAQIVRGVGGRILALNPLHPDRMAVKQRADLTLEYHYTRQDGREIVFSQDQVFHLVGMSLDGITGVSVIRYARETIGLSMTMENHGASLFKNAARMAGALSHPAKLGPEAIETLRDSLAAYRAGGESEGNFLILEEGMEPKSLSMTAEDAQWIESRKFSRTDIAMFFGVPPHMIGDTEKSTSWGTGVEAQTQGFVTFSVEDDLTTWEQAIDAQLLGEGEADLYARFNRASLVRGDLKARWEAYVRGLQWGVFSPNDVRASEDENPREGGDVYYEPPNTAGGQSSQGTSE
jgi:HK97 family phage portal protein